LRILVWSVNGVRALSDVGGLKLITVMCPVESLGGTLCPCWNASPPLFSLVLPDQWFAYNSSRPAAFLRTPFFGAPVVIVSPQVGVSARFVVPLSSLFLSIGCNIFDSSMIRRDLMWSRGNFSFRPHRGFLVKSGPRVFFRLFVLSGSLGFFHSR